MKIKMNIFDLCWCKLYLYAERNDIGFYVVSASLWMTFFLELFIVGLVCIFDTIGLYKLPNLSYLPCGIGLTIIVISLFIRYGNKKVLKERLSIYQKYNNENPKKTKFRFWSFIITSIKLPVTDMIMINIRYALLHSV